MQCIQTTNPHEKSSVYQTITTPNNMKCDWKEKIFLDLQHDVDWRSLHLRFNLYKHKNERQRRLYGFSYLPLKNEENTIVCDGSTELFVFQIHKDHELKVDDYLGKNLFRHDSTIKGSKISEKGFTAVTNDKLEVRTQLISTQMTDQPAIFDLLNVDVETAKVDDVDAMLSRYINMEGSHQSKRILFITQILERLWKIATHIPDQEDKVFDAFIATIHPIKTDSVHFGYANEYLERYIDSEFHCPEIFEKFVKSFTKMIENIETGKTFEKYKMMCIPLIFKLMVRAYQIKKDSTGQCDTEIFTKLVEAIGDFLRGSVESKSFHSHTFKAFFELETINLVSQLAPGILVVDILKDIVDNTPPSVLGTRFNAIWCILGSRIYQDAENQETVFQLALSLIKEQMSKLSAGSDLTNFRGLDGFNKGS